MIVSYLSQINCSRYICLISTAILTPEQASYHGVVTYHQNNREFLKRSMSRLDHAVGLACLIVWNDEYNKDTIITITSILCRRPIIAAVFFAEDYGIIKPVFNEEYIIEKISPFMKTVRRHVDKIMYVIVSEAIDKYYASLDYDSDDDRDKRRSDEKYIIECRFRQQYAIHSCVHGIYDRHGVDVAAHIRPHPIHVSHVTPDHVEIDWHISPTGLIYRSDDYTNIIEDIMMYWILLGYDAIEVFKVWLPLYTLTSISNTAFFVSMHCYATNPPKSGDGACLKKYLRSTKPSQPFDLTGTPLEHEMPMKYVHVLNMFRRPPIYVKYAREALLRKSEENESAWD